MTNPAQTTISSITHSARQIPLRRAVVAASIAAVAILAAACSSGQSASTTPSTGSTGSTTSVKLASATLPDVGSVLTGPDGRTLYYFTTDTPTSSTCTGECAVVWPPLVVPAGAKATLASGVAGSLGTATRPDGSAQVTYDGHLLYYYEGDKATGQDKGQGLDGTWFVVSTSGAGSPTTPTTTSAGVGGGGVGY